MIPITRPCLGDEEINAAADVIHSGWLSQGPKVNEFEEAFKHYTDSKYACATSNCTAALHLALLAVDVGPQDAVITVSHSFIATANSIRYCQARPIFLDVDPATYNIDAVQLKQYLKANLPQENRIKAILFPHQMGMPCDMKAICSIAKDYHLPVIEDAACAIGSEISMDEGQSWQKIGRPHGDIACFSFHPRKLITTGEGGMITTGDQTIDQRVRLLRHQGMSVSDLDRHHAKQVVIEDYPVVGFNYRMTDIQAAIGIVQLQKINEMLEKRKKIACLYQRELKNISWLILPQQSKYVRWNWQSFPARLKDDAPIKRAALMQKLLDAGIASKPGIMNAHQEKAYEQSCVQLPESEKARDFVILLPIFASMKDQEVVRVTEVIKSV